MTASDTPAVPAGGAQRTRSPGRSRTLLAALASCFLGACTTTSESHPRPSEPWVDGHLTGTFVIDTTSAGESSLIGILRGYVRSVSSAGQIAPNELALDAVVRTEHRPKLIEDLDAHAHAHPPDGRVEGFRVGLRMTQGRFDEAL